MAAKAIVSALAMASFVVAAPTATLPPTFHLEAKLSGPNNVVPNFHSGMEVGYYVHKSQGPILTVSDAPGACFSSRGSTTRVIGLPHGHTSGIVVTPGGTATVPALRPVKLAGEGSSGVEIVDGKLSYEAGHWMLCPPSTLSLGIDEKTLVVVYKSSGQRTISGCNDIDIVAK